MRWAQALVAIAAVSARTSQKICGLRGKPNSHTSVECGGGNLDFGKNRLGAGGHFTEK